MPFFENPLRTVPADDAGWNLPRRFLVNVLGEAQLRAPDGESSITKEALTRRGQIVRWSRILLRAILALLVVVFVDNLVFDAIVPLKPGSMTGRLLTVVGVMVGVGVAFYARRTVRGLRPRPAPLPAISPVEQRLRSEAVNYGGGLGARVCVGAVIAAALLSSLLPSDWAASPVAVVLVGFLSVVLGIWIGRLARAEYQDLLARQDPRRAIPNLAERAQAVQEAMERAAHLAEELQDEVNVQQRVLDEIKLQVADYRNTAAIGEAEAESVVRVMGARYKRERSWSLWSGAAVSIVVAFISWFLGGLFSPEPLWELMRR